MSNIIRILLDLLDGLLQLVKSLFKSVGNVSNKKTKKRIKTDSKEYLAIFALAEQGDIHAQYELAQLCAANEDDINAFNWYLKAAKQGHVKAQEIVAILYTKGKGVEHSWSEAFKWHLKRADAGDVNAQLTIASLYDGGKGVARDYAQAVKWYEVASARGSADAEYFLAVAYFQGKGVAQDYASALKHFLLASERGHAGAEYKIGWMYYQGKSVEQSYTKSFEWITKSAEKGNVDAQATLGEMYYEGKGVRDDKILAYKWFTLASMGKGHSQGVGKQQREMIAREIIPAHIQRGQLLADEWIAEKKGVRPDLKVDTVAMTSSSVKK